MSAPIIHRSTGSSHDCRRGCAEWSNSLWRLPGPKTHSDDFMRLRSVMCIRSPADSEDGTEGKPSDRRSRERKTITNDIYAAAQAAPVHHVKPPLRDSSVLGLPCLSETHCSHPPPKAL